MRFSPEAPAGACLVNADCHMITRVFENLIANALSHTPAGGTVHLTWSASDGGALAKVADRVRASTPSSCPSCSRRPDRDQGGVLTAPVWASSSAGVSLRAHGGDLGPATCPVAAPS